MRRLLLPLVACLLSLAGPSTAAPAPLDSVSVRVEPASATVDLGEDLVLHVTVSNAGNRPTPALVVHLDITDPSRSTSVDPEDWTSTLSRNVDPVPAGGSTTLDWRVQPIGGGAFLAYVVALEPGSTDLVTSNAVRVDVGHRRTLNPRGILAVAVGVPVLIGGLLLAQVRRSRRRR
jgi:uncharacterized membrane protein